MTKRLLLRSVLWTLLTACGGPGEPSGDGAPEPSRVTDTGTTKSELTNPVLLPLYTWYSPTRGDSFTTADPNWTSSRANRSPDYRFVRVEGFVFSPSAGQPQDTVALYSWYSPSRGDNLLTTDPAWSSYYAGTVKWPDYTFVRTEGFVHSKPLAGTQPLATWWSPSRADTFTTADPMWAGAIGWKSPDYSYSRTEGYLMPAPDSERVPEAQAFGYRNLTVNGKPASSWRPLLLVVGTLPESTIPYAHEFAYYDNLVFGWDMPNIIDYYLEVSNSTFSWSRAGAYRITFRKGTTSIEERAADAIHKVAVLGFNFASYDSNGDGHVTPDELGLLVIDNGTTIGAASRGASPSCVRPSGSTVDVCPYATGPGGVGIVGTSAAGEEASFASIAHELAHQLGAWDLYGSAGLSPNATLMGPTIYSALDDRQRYHMDPWHKLQLGWVQPKVRSILDPGVMELVNAPQTLWNNGISNESPIILFDPRRGTSEYFLLEYRNPWLASGGRYDANVYDWGVAVWYVKQDANKNPVLIPGMAGGSSQDRAVFTLAAPSGARGGWDLWDSYYNGAFPLRWLDGSDSGVRVRSAQVSGLDTLPIEWTLSSRPLSPRIDRTSAGYAVLGATFELYGLFGTEQGSRTVSWDGLYAGHVPLTVERWTPTQLTLRIPSTAPRGAGSIFVNTDSTRSVRSNGVYVNLE